MPNPNSMWSFVPSILLLAVLTSPGCAPGDRPDILALATAGTGGVYYVLGGSIAELWSRDLPKLDFVAEGRILLLAGAVTAFFPSFLVGGLGALFVVAYTLNDVRYRAPNPS